MSYTRHSQVLEWGKHGLNRFNQPFEQTNTVGKQGIIWDTGLHQLLEKSWVKATFHLRFCL